MIRQKRTLAKSDSIPIEEMIQGVPESENQKEAAENSAPKEEDIPQSGDTGALSKMLSHLPARWRNWWIRVSTSFLMLFGFIFIGYLGPLAIVLLILAIQLKAFHEVCSSNRISWRLKSVHNKTGLRTGSSRQTFFRAVFQTGK